ncbi:DUF4189 domain-containing protein [Leeia sp. TBRC 13508]|uniref:DUF4189 domain-containing protein n=1 Tax=Leeia speluncae TaxID=2884804 RepID=A0ABS8D3Q7_9NEIS|nr:DUF4189 domain-containing protein [Leeia speluncae]MCB6182809.1 DUF4189 domain-containing protein [Leeia speluncae]
MKRCLRTLLLSSIALTMSLLVQADSSLCYQGGNYDASSGTCHYPDGSRAPHPGGNIINRNQNMPRDYFGAVAVDLQGGDRSFNSNNYRSASEAKQAALKGCGLPGCKVIIAYKNGCGTAAYSSDTHVVGGIGDSPEEAEQDALDKCEQTKNGGQCQIWGHYKTCSYYQ